MFGIFNSKFQYVDKVAIKHKITELYFNAYLEQIQFQYCIQQKQFFFPVTKTNFIRC